jgi:hypothetical protein
MQGLGWEWLQSPEALSAAAVIIIEYVKDVPGIRRIPTKLLALIVGEVLVMLTIQPFPTTLRGLAVIWLDGLLVGAASIGGWHLVLEWARRPEVVRRHVRGLRDRRVSTRG